MTPTELENAIIASFGLAEWHVSLWFPRPARQVLNLPANVTDVDIQNCLIRLISAGVIESGTVEGAEFTRADLSTAGGDLYLRMNEHATLNC